MSFNSLDGSGNFIYLIIYLIKYSTTKNKYKEILIYTNIISIQILDIIDTLKEVPNLHVLNMLGNPVVRKTKDYRRHMIHKEFIHFRIFS